MTIKCVYANGDSFVAGYGLESPYVSRLDNWTGQIARKLGIDLENDYYNDAKPGGPNDRIVRTTLETLPKLLEKYAADEILVLIGFTQASRIERYFSKQDQYIQLMGSYDSKVNWDQPISDYHKLYYTHFDNEKEHQDRFVSQVLLLQLYLQSTGVKFLFTNALPIFGFPAQFPGTGEYNLFKMQCADDKFPEVAKLINMDTYLDHVSCYYYLSIIEKMQMLPCHHPTYDGHLCWADYVVNYMRENQILLNV